MFLLIFTTMNIKTVL